MRNGRAMLIIYFVKYVMEGITTVCVCIFYLLIS